MSEGFPEEPVNQDQQQVVEPQHIDVQAEVPVDVVHNVEQNESQTQRQAEKMDESAEAFHGRMSQLIDEGRDIFVFRGAGTKNGIAEQDVPGAVEKIQATLQASLEAGKKVAIMFDGDEDNRQKPDVGAIFGIVADSLKDNPDVVAIAAQQESWYYPDTEGGELKTATGTPYETFVFPDSTPGGHASLTQSKDLAQYDNYKQFFVGPAGAIAGDQLRDLNEKAQGRPEDNKVEVVVIATHNNASLTQEFDDKAKAADEAGETAKADGFRATLAQRQEQPFGMMYSADGYKSFQPRDYPNVDIKFDESLVSEFQEMRSKPVEGTWDKDKASTMAAVLQADPSTKYEVDNLTDQLEVRRQSAQEFLNEDELQPAKFDIQWAKEQAEEAREQHGVDSDYARLYDQKVAMAEAEIPALEKSIADRVEEAVKESRLQRQERTLNSLELAERLYDMNPGKFAEMPTSEFMDSIRELNKMIEEREESNYAGGYAREALSHLKRAEEHGTTVDINNMRVTLNASLLESDLGELEWNKYGIPAEVVESDKFRNDGPGYVVVDQIMKVGRYDKSPRQVNDALKALFQDLLDKRTAQYTAAVQTVEDFFDKQAPAKQ